MDYVTNKIEKEIPVNHAILKIKHLSKSGEDVFFEDMIEDEKNLISIDFLNGKTLSESGFSKVNTSTDKYYLDFFDNFDYKNIMDYLDDDNSNFRVTDVYGTIVRPSHSDLKKLGYNDSGEKLVIRAVSKKDE